VIAKVLRGWRPGGLLAYLFGPGRFEEHRDPRVVASWDGAPWLHQPDKLASVVLDGEVLEPGEFDFDLRQLITTMQELAPLAGLPVHNPRAITADWAEHLRSGAPLPADAPPWVRYYKYDPKAKAVVLRPGWVWHCPVRLHPDDPILSDDQWQHIAQRLMQATGIHQAGCRWVAVRHADDHIHLVATLVSERTSGRFHPYRDYPKLRAACQQLERELGLVGTAGADRTAVPAPTRGEQGKAARSGRAGTAREDLHRSVAQCAAISRDGAQFLTELQREGLDPRTVLDSAGQVRGYTVALPGDRTATGERVRYSGSTLGSDLSWSKLMARWASTPPLAPIPRNEHGRVPPSERHAAIRHAAAVVERATRVLRDADADGAEGIAHATGEVLAALSRGREGHTPGPLTEIAGCYDRAARTPHRVLPVDIGLVARDLRHAARWLGAVGVLSGRGEEKLATITLVLALAGLVAEIAAWQQLRGRVHQAAAARSAARALPTVVGADAGQRRPATRPVQSPASALQRPVMPRRDVLHRDEFRPRPRDRG